MSNVLGIGPSFRPIMHLPHMWRALAVDMYVGIPRVRLDRALLQTHKQSLLGCCGDPTGGGG